MGGELNSWSLPYAPHLGILSPDEGFFRKDAGPDPVKQIEYAAAKGFCAICDNGLMSRPPDERRRMREAMDASAVLLSSFVDHLAEPTALWTSSGPEQVQQLRRRLVQAFETGSQLRARHLTVTSRTAEADEGIAPSQQLEAFAENLAWAAPLAAEFGIRLALEPVSRRRVAGMLVTTVDQAAAIVAATRSSNLVLVFDTEHVANESGDVVAAFRRVSAYVGLIQISGPSRADIEPDGVCVPLLREALAAGYDGIIELEYMPSGAGTADSMTKLSVLDHSVAAGLLG
jgi:hydroxypyruvate isomerase